MSKLIIVGTPIGNLKDITLRALDALKNSKVIACEDTRVTKNLFSQLDITLEGKRFLAYHDQNEEQSAKGLIDIINQGEEIVLVSDAGMPVISDPGFRIINKCIESNIKLEIIPGVSAVTTALVLSNFDTHFQFLGFLKPKTIQRQNQLAKLQKGTYVVFVSPHQLEQTLIDIDLVFKNNAKVFLGRELTKFYESHYRGYALEVLEQVKDKIKGEFTLVLEVTKGLKHD